MYTGLVIGLAVFRLRFRLFAGLQRTFSFAAVEIMEFDYSVGTLAPVMPLNSQNKYIEI
jgi:hypothetical protein